MKRSISMIVFIMVAIAWVSPALAQGPLVLSIGSEEVCGSFNGARPRIDTDSLNQPHIITDEGSSTRLYTYNKIGGDWSGGEFAKGSRGGTYDASRLYMPNIEIDASDRAWYSTKFGVKEFGAINGQGIWCYDNIDSAPTKRFYKFVSANTTHKGNGNIALDPFKPNEGIDICSVGKWARINASGSITQTGSWNLGASGEKVRGRIAARDGQVGIWHAVMGGYSGAGSPAGSWYINSAMGGSNARWARYTSYTEMGHDMQHPGIGLDLSDPEVAYIGAYYHGLVVNIWDGNGMVFADTSLLKVDPSGKYMDRYGPQFAPANDTVNGGAFVCWTRSSRVLLRYISKTGTLGDEIDASYGSRGSIATDTDGNIHLVYMNGGTRYRFLQMSGSMRLVGPKGEITGTLRPEFSWNDTNSVTYDLIIECGGNPYLTTNVAGTNWTPSADFIVQNYQWYVEGNTEPHTNRAGPATFWIPPPAPVLLEPDTASFYTNEPPAISWTQVPEATWYHLYVKRGTETVVNYWLEGTANTNWTPSNVVWEAGTYDWWVHSHSGSPTYSPAISGAWSAGNTFYLGAPTTAPTPTSPNGTTYSTGMPQFVWAGNAQCTGYDVYVSKGGAFFARESVDGNATTTWDPAGLTFTAGNYQWWTRGRNSYGDGPWSTAGPTFTVAAPGTATLLAPTGTVVVARPDFAWEQVATAAEYQFVIYRGTALWTNIWITGSANTNYTLLANLDAGQYRWWIQTRNPAGLGGWSTPLGIGYLTVPPGASSEIAPAGTLAGVRAPTFYWEDVNGADWFQLWLGSGGSSVATKWIKNDTNWTLNVELPGGNYDWFVRPYNQYGFGPWSAGQAFTITAATPAAANLVSPTGGVAQVAGSINYIWTADSDATYYRLYISRNGRRIHNTWYHTGVVPGPVLQSVGSHTTGNYQWWVRTWGPDGFGPWSGTGDFTIP